MNKETGIVRKKVMKAMLKVGLKACLAWCVASSMVVSAHGAQNSIEWYKAKHTIEGTYCWYEYQAGNRNIVPATTRAITDEELVLQIKDEILEETYREIFQARLAIAEADFTTFALFSGLGFAAGASSDFGFQGGVVMAAIANLLTAPSYNIAGDHSLRGPAVTRLRRAEAALEEKIGGVEVAAACARKSCGLASGYNLNNDARLILSFQQALRNASQSRQDDPSLVCSASLGDQLSKTGY